MLYRDLEMGHVWAATVDKTSFFSGSRDNHACIKHSDTPYTSFVDLIVMQHWVYHRADRLLDPLFATLLVRKLPV